MAGGVFGRAVLAVTSNPTVASVAQRSAISGGLVRRFVAGETLDDAIEAVRMLNAQGMRVALDQLGENTATPEDAVAATDEAVHALERVRFAGVDAYMSIKLTQLGLDLGEHLVLDNARRLLERARALHNFICIDMEGSTYTARTLELYTLLREAYDNVGTVIQAYLYRSMADLRELVGIGAQIRLVKGAYNEPAHIAYRRKRDTDRNYVRLMEFLLVHGRYPALATHDPAIIEHARRFAQAQDIGSDRFEFQMLYGVRRDLQEELLRRGFNVRIYLPYGAQWYPYLTRRLAERPANLIAVAGSVVRERASVIRAEAGREDVR